MTVILALRRQSGQQRKYQTNYGGGSRVAIIIQ